MMQALVIINKFVIFLKSTFTLIYNIIVEEWNNAHFNFYERSIDKTILLRLIAVRVNTLRDLCNNIEKTLYYFYCL